MADKLIGGKKENQKFFPGVAKER